MISIFLALTLIVIAFFAGGYIGFRVGMANVEPVKVPVVPPVPWEAQAKELASGLGALGATVRALEKAAGCAKADLSEASAFVTTVGTSVESLWKDIGHASDLQGAAAEKARLATEKLHGGLEGLQLLLNQNAAKAGSALRELEARLQAVEIPSVGGVVKPSAGVVTIEYRDDKGGLMGTETVPAKTRRVRRSFKGQPYEAGEQVDGVWVYRRV